MIYLDNSATTYPKPMSVKSEMQRAMQCFGANPGRGGYSMSNSTALEIYRVRSLLAELFNAESEENIVFTFNCTHALNIAIKGLAKKGGHAVTSCLEHNAVMRPLYKLKSTEDFHFDIAQVYSDDDKTVKSFESKIRKNTCFIVATYASNVFGDILPIEKLGKLAKKYNIPLIVDAAQAAGVIDIDVKRDNISCLCMPGHKGLYGPSGTGVLVLSNNLSLNTLIEGGTGSNSKDFFQPDFLPDRFESGTQNTCGIIALGKGIEFIKKERINYIREKECEMIDILYRNFLHSDVVYLYNKFEHNKFVPILSFNLKNRTGEETAGLLSKEGIATRGGFHCNYSAHRFYRTEDTGTVRVSVSTFNTKRDIIFLINSANKIAKI